MHRARTNRELRVGDCCYALAKMVEWEWYRARLIGVRNRNPSLKVEYLANLDGDSSRLALPQPLMNHVPVEHVRLSPPPQDAQTPVVPPSAPCVAVVGPSTTDLPEEHPPRE